MVCIFTMLYSYCIVYTFWLIIGVLTCMACFGECEFIRLKKVGEISCIYFTLLNLFNGVGFHALRFL